MLRIVVDTNLWIRILLGGQQSLPLLRAWQEARFEVVISEPLLDELDMVRQRPRLMARIDSDDALDLIEQLRQRGVMVEAVSIPPQCRDPKDHPVLATAIDGAADAVVTGDSDLRGDDLLREAMAGYNVELWGMERLMAHLDASV